MYYNVIIKDSVSEGYSWENELIFHFGNDLHQAISFCETVLKTSDNSVEILQFYDKEEN